MGRFFRLSVVFVILVALSGIVSPIPGYADSPIATGKWTGYFSRNITITNSVSGVTIKATGDAKADLNLQVDGNGGVTGTVGPYHAEVKWSANIGGVQGSCTFDFTWNVTSGTVTENPAHLPAFDLQLDLTQSNIQCNPDVGGGLSVQKNSVHFEAKTASSGKLTGEKVRFQTDMMELAVANVKKAGAQVSTKEYWELNSSGASVDVIMPDFEQYFLEGVPFQNKYTAIVDWHNNPPGKVNFTLGGQSQELPGDSEVSASFELGGLPAPKDPLVVTAIGSDGQPSGSNSQDVIIVPLDGWAQKAHFTAGETKQDGIQHVVIYQGKTSVPPQPVKLPYLDLSSIPFLGGKWGVPPFQVDVNLLANSGGGLSDLAPVSGKAALYLGSDSPKLSMKVDGQAVTNLTQDALLFDHGQANFTLPPYTLEHQVGLADAIPATSGLYTYPPIANALKAANSLLGITLQLTAQAKGQADLAAAADKSQLVFDKGDLTPSVLVSAKPGVNIPGIISLGVGGGGKGSFTIRIAPNPGLENCLVSLNFSAHVSVLNLVNENYQSPPYQVAQCSPTTLNGQAVLAVYLPESISTQLRSASRSKTLPVRTKSVSRSLQSGRDAILVSGASPQAELNLAIGPQGRMAFIYTKGDQGGVVLRIFDGQTWGEPISLGEAGRSDLSPAVAFDAKGQIVAAWVQPGSSGTPTPDQMETYARSWEIAYAVLDSSGKLLSQGNLTENQDPDFAPQISRARDGSVWLAWLQSPAADIWGPKEQPNLLRGVRWNGKWSKVETISDKIVGALGFRLAALNSNEALAVASLDMDGNPETVKDLEVYAFQRSGNQWKSLRLTNDQETDAFPLAAYTSDGKPALAWRRGGSVVGLEGDLSVQPQEWKVGNSGQIPDLAGGELLGGANGELGLLWTGFADQGQGVWLAKRTGNGEWQAPKALVDGLGGADRLSASLGQDGSVWFGLAQLQVPSKSQEIQGLGQVSISGLPASADLAVVGAEGALSPLPAQSTANEGNTTGLGGISNLTRLLILGIACIIVLALLGGGLSLLVLRLRKKRT